MDDFSIWTKVVTHPLGFAGFVMFLVFLVLSKVVKSGSNRTITLRVFLVLSVVSLVGGLLLDREQGKSNERIEPSRIGSIEITGNSDVKTGSITTNVNINDKTTKASGLHVGSVEIKNNKGKLETGNIETHVTSK